MNKNLRTALQRMTEVDYHELQYCMQTADMVRCVQKKYELTDEEMASNLALSTVDFFNFKVGAYPYALSDLAKVHALESVLETERIKNKKPLEK